MSKHYINVNGESMLVEDRPNPELLVNWLRDSAKLTGVHRGCDTAQCGACTVIVDGLPTKACSVLALQVIGSDVMTVEGLKRPDGTLHPLQQAFIDHRAVQCGYCTPGMLMAGISIISQHKDSLDEGTVREGLEGNLCRCTGYQPIVQAILACREKS
jgi:aerobic carbon-monoxide dehydrogenase small subunit